MRNKRLISVALLMVLALFGAACAQEDEPGASPGAGDSDKPEYTIGFMGALTGDLAQLVIHSRNAAQLAIDEANEEGELPVRLKLQAEDTTGDKDKAVPLAQKLAGDEKVLAVIGPAFSGESFSSNPILTQQQIPHVTPSATNPGLAAANDKYWFRALGNDNAQGGPAPDVFISYLKASKVYIGHDKSAYGEGLATIVRDGLQKKQGSAVAGFEAVDPGQKDYSPLATKLVSSGADVFFWGGYSPEGALIIKQAKEKGFKGTYVGADGSKDDQFLKDAGESANGAVHLCPCADIASSDEDASKDFAKAYKDETKQEPGIYAGEGYDVANIIINAIKTAGEPGSDIKAYRDEIRDAIAKTKGYKGLTKTYSFQPNGELVNDAVTIYLYKVENRKFTFLGKVDDLVKA